MPRRSEGSLARCVALAAVLAGTGAAAAPYVETPSLAERVANGGLPPVEHRLPARPSVAPLAGDGLAPGRHGGELRLLMGRAKDVRLMVVYGYARLVGYDRDYRLVPDLLEDVEVRDGRTFTLRLRPGHRWSDGHPFTAEDFRYYWEDVATDDALSPFGPPRAYLVEGEPPRFEVLDAHTVRYTWPRPNPFFLPALAAARPEPLYAPAHYLGAFHARYGDEDALDARARSEGKRHWAALHTSRFRPYKNTNPDLPTLQPWVAATAPPSQRFVFARNPYYHRVDANGRQLPYIDRVVMNIAAASLVPAKTGAGESDLQARHLAFDDYTFLKQGEKRNANRVRLWETTRGAHVALYPNLNVEDPGWRALLRDVRFRRALSLAIDRHEINQVVYFGLATEGNDTVHARSPLFDDDHRTRWARFDLDAANALLDEIGLVERNDEGIRRMPDGRALEIIVETAGEDTEQTDVLELVGWTWREAGIKLFSKPLQREVFRNRIASGRTVVSVWGGLENGLPLPDMSPRDLAPTRHDQYQWPQWGRYYETAGAAGEPPALAPARELAELDRRWLSAPDTAARRPIWERMLAIRADNVFSIGIVSGVPQPVVVDARLRNVPERGIYNWEPGAWFTSASTARTRSGSRTERAMLQYTIRRVFVMIPTLVVISALVFVIIQLPEGDYLSSYIAELEATGEKVSREKVEFLRAHYGLDRPVVEQYAAWVAGMLHGDFGYSFEHDLPVSEVVGDRLFLTFLLSFSTILFTWVVAFPIGVYSATHQYSWGDHGLTLVGFLGLATPNFLLALVLLYLANVVFGTSIGGLMDPEFVDQPMSWPKFVSVLEHLWIPVVVIGTSGTAGMIRRLRANLLDELRKQYVVTGRAKGLPPFRLLVKYPLRMSLNPFIADIGNLLPQVVSGAAIVSVVLSLPTTGPMLVRALQSQDMYLAGSFLMFLAVLTVVGMFLSDLALAALDPRIRLGGGARR